MPTKLASPSTRSGLRARNAPQAFRADDAAASTVAFTIAGLTITTGGLIAWVAYGTVMLWFAELGLGAIFAFAGLAVLAGVVTVLIIKAKGG